MDYYNWQRPHSHNKMIAPVLAEKNLIYCLEIVDHYTELKAQLVVQKKELERLVERTQETTSPTLIAAYEKRIHKAEDEKILLKEKSAKMR